MRQQPTPASSSSSSSSHHQHHQYVNAIPTSKGGHRLINQTDLCTQIISGNANLKPTVAAEVSGVANSFLSASSSSSSASSSSSVTTPSSSKNMEQRIKASVHHQQHNHTSACCGINDHKIAGADTNTTTSQSSEDLIGSKQSMDDIHQRSTLLADSSMRCTLRRGRPNTPKTGLSIEYRVRKSSVPNTPETSTNTSMSHRHHHAKINHTISNDDMKFAGRSGKSASNNAVIRNLLDMNKKDSLKLLKSGSQMAGLKIKGDTHGPMSTADGQATVKTDAAAMPTTTSSASLNTAMVQLDEEERMLAAGAKDDLNDARLLDMAFNEDDDELLCAADEDADNEENVNEKHVVGDELENCNSISGASSRSRSRSNSLSSHSSRSSSATSSSSTSIISHRSTPACTGSPPKIRKSTRQLSVSLTNLPTSQEEMESAASELAVKQVEGVVEESETASNDVEMTAAETESKDKFDLPIIKLNSKSSLAMGRHQEAPVAEMTAPESSSANSSIAKKIIEEQEKMIKFEPFEFKLPNPIEQPSDSDDGMFKKPSSFQLMLEEQSKLMASGGGCGSVSALESSENSEDLLQNTLRRQSLFKLKEKINGKVSKQVSEIEKRKLSPHRFFNSPLKQSKKAAAAKELNMAAAAIASSTHASKHVSPLRVPSIFCKKIMKSMTTTPDADKQDTQKTKPSISKLSKTIATTNAGDLVSSPLAKPAKHRFGQNSNSPSIARVASQFYRKFNKTRSVKRLNATMSHHHYPLQMQQPQSAALLTLAAESMLLERRLTKQHTAGAEAKMEEESGCNDKENVEQPVNILNKEAGFAKIKKLDVAKPTSSDLRPFTGLQDTKNLHHLQQPQPQQHNSPTKHFNLMSTELKFTSESIDF